MRSSLAFLVVVVVAAVVAVPAGAKAPIPIRIQHVTHGCHTWSVGTSAANPTQTLRVNAGTSFVIMNNDVMAHRLVQVAGPKVSLHLSTMMMGHMGAMTTLTLRTHGVYRFITKAGEDYPGIHVKTIGKDNVLRLMVVVV